jgi:hypothetical protein
MVVVVAANEADNRSFTPHGCVCNCLGQRTPTAQDLAIAALLAG